MNLHKTHENGIHEIVSSHSRERRACVYRQNLSLCLYAWAVEVELLWRKERKKNYNIAFIWIPLLLWLVVVLCAAAKELVWIWREYEKEKKSQKTESLEGFFEVHYCSLCLIFFQPATAAHSQLSSCMSCVH